MGEGSPTKIILASREGSRSFAQGLEQPRLSCQAGHRLPGHLERESLRQQLRWEPQHAITRSLVGLADLEIWSWVPTKLPGGDYGRTFTCLAFLHFFFTTRLPMILKSWGGAIVLSFRRMGTRVFPAPHPRESESVSEETSSPPRKNIIDG